MNAAFSKLLTDLSYQNQVLKAAVTGLIAIAILALSGILVIANRGPTVIGISPSGDPLELGEKLTDKQLEAGIRHYVKLRYNWKKENLASQAPKTEVMIASGSVSAFRKTIQDLLKFMTQTNVEQRVLPRSIQIDSVKSEAYVIADRINDIETLKAATELRVLLKYSMGDRTLLNPWGIYIEKESEGEVK